MNSEINSGASLADKVYAQLENDILSGVLTPDTPLSENKISAQLGVSRTPVREAFRRLEQDGLVSSVTGRGTVVLGVDDADVSDIFEIRQRLEGMAAARAAERMTPEQLSELEGVVELQEFYAMKGDPDGLRDTDSRFHELIYKCSGSRVLEELLGSLHHRIQRFRRKAMESEQRAERSAAEHRAILEALRSRDAEQAEKLVAEHIANARSNLTKK